MIEEKEKLQNELEELKQLRKKLSADFVTEETKIDEIKENHSKITETYNSSTNISDALKQELINLDEEINKKENELKKIINEYDETTKRLKNIITEYNTKMENSELLSAEEIKQELEQNEKQKLEENNKSSELKKKFDIIKRIIKELKAKKTKIENNIKTAEALDLTLEEYKEITDTIRNTTIMNAILETKDLTEIINKSVKERTKEEKELLKNTKEEILVEISKTKKVTKENILDTIEALYSLEITYINKGKPRITQIASSKLDLIEKQSLDLPYKIINATNFSKNYIPEKAPKDMENIIQSNEIKAEISNMKPAEEKITIFKADENYYVRKYTVSRLKLKTADLKNEVRIKGSACYKIEKSDVEKILNHEDNTISEYINDIQEISLEKETDSLENNKTELQKSDETDNIVNENSDNKNEKEKNDNYLAANIKSTDNFKNELKSGNYLYNIVHVVTANIKIGADIRKATSFEKHDLDNGYMNKEEIEKMLEENLDKNPTYEKQNQKQR